MGKVVSAWYSLRLGAMGWLRQRRLSCGRRRDHSQAELVSVSMIRVHVYTATFGGQNDE